MFKFVKRQIIRPVWRFFTKGSRSKAQRMLIAYVIGLLPSNYLTTALTTSSNVMNPNQVIQVAKKTGALTSVGGIINTATGGLTKPILNGVGNVAGHITEGIGNTFKLDGFVHTGQKWVEDSKKWFTAGANLNSSSNTEKSKQSGTAGSSTSTNSANSAASSSSSTSSDSSASSTSPAYPKDFYRVEGPAIHHIDRNEMIAMIAKSPKEGLFEYQENGDELGRTLTAVGVITKVSIDNSAGTREKFEKGSDPSGWPKHNPKIDIKLPNGNTYHGYAWNRSHLIADSLGGRAYRWNLITGSRMQNVGANDQKGGMQYIEKKVIDYIRERPDQKVYYKAEPIYEGDELVPRTVEVTAYSTNGELDEHVITYNVLPEYEINYNDSSITKK